MGTCYCVVTVAKISYLVRLGRKYFLLFVPHQISHSYPCASPHNISKQADTPCNFNIKISVVVLWLLSELLLSKLFRKTRGRTDHFVTCLQFPIRSAFLLSQCNLFGFPNFTFTQRTSSPVVMTLIFFLYKSLQIICSTLHVALIEDFFLLSTC